MLRVGDFGAACWLKRRDFGAAGRCRLVVVVLFLFNTRVLISIFAASLC